MILNKILPLLLLVVCVGLTAQETTPDYLNNELNFEERAKDLVSKLTVEEKIAQMSNGAPAIDRLGVPAFNYQGEALHGLAEAWGGRLMEATSFPQSIAMGSTWNPDLILEVATAISDEARAYYNVGEMDVSFWSPNINMLRDPRWGRNDEAYSEDPFLMSKIAVSFVKGLQGDHPIYLKSVASPKHFVANNSEFNRHDGTSDVAERWLREYYFPSYKACFHEGGAFATMCAYNRLNEVPACGNKWLLSTVLRDEWGFEGYVVSDCGAIYDIYENHKYVKKPEQAAALAVKSGCDLNCGNVYEEALQKAYKKGLISEEYLDKAVYRLFLARYKLGMFAPEGDVPYDTIGRDVIESEKHRLLAHKAARESIILLKNDKDLLPFSDDVQSIAVIGPNATEAVLGAYSGKPSRRISTLDGIREKVADKIEVHYKRGCNITTPDKIDFDPEDIEEIKYIPLYEQEEVLRIHEEYKKETRETDEVLIQRAEKLAGKVDRVVLVMGTNRFISTEEADAENLSWPGNQGELIRRVYQANPNVVLVLVNGFQITMNWEKENVPAIVEAWYAGQEQGHAIADVLFGDYNPGGRLPVTYYKSEEDLPPVGDYDITKGRTYWFFEKDVLFPFGHGLSYTSFEYSNLKVSDKTIKISESGELTISVDIMNTGELKGDEVVQLYLKDVESSVIQPVKELRGFKRISLEKGDKTSVTFNLSNEDFRYWDESSKDWSIELGKFEIQIGASSSDIKLKESIVVN